MTLNDYFEYIWTITLAAGQQGKASTSCPLDCNVCVITDVITGKQGVRIGDGAADDHSLKLFIKSERVQLIIFKLVYDS